MFRQVPDIQCRHKEDGIFIRIQDYYRKILYEDILWLESSGHYTSVCMRGKGKVLACADLKRLHAQLPASRFVRVHNRYVLNVFEIELFFGNTLRIQGQDFPIGRTFRKDALAQLNILTLRPDGNLPSLAE